MHEGGSACVESFIRQWAKRDGPTMTTQQEALRFSLRYWAERYWIDNAGALHCLCKASAHANDAIKLPMAVWAKVDMSGISP